MRRTQALDDVPVFMKKPRTAFMVKRCISEKGREKQLEKELPWGMIPPEERPLFREAELKQWNQHVDFRAVRPLSIEESEKIRRTVDPKRILRSRFAYKDKNYAKRKVDGAVPPRPKARLCIAGHCDPDLGSMDMQVDAPTTGRHSILLALQLGLNRRWRTSVGDIKAAFLNGVPAPRSLFFSQPKNGIPSLDPRQLVEVLKGVFGLSTSPKLWWIKLSKDIVTIKVDYHGTIITVKQNQIDPCAFCLCDEKGIVRGMLLTHVDDIMLTAEPELVPLMQTALQEKFPVDEWQADEFEYVGCEYKCTDDYVHISQKGYAAGRLDKVTAKPGAGGVTTKEQIEENRTSIGSLSWLSKQTRPDLQFRVSQAQRAQNDPTQEDIKKTNKAVEAALEFQDKGITLRRLDEKKLAFVTFHDAAWANVDPADQNDEDKEWLSVGEPGDDHREGRLRVRPSSFQSG